MSEGAARRLPLAKTRIWSTGERIRVIASEATPFVTQPNQE
jgi:hypothetical protein